MPTPSAAANAYAALSRLRDDTAAMARGGNTSGDQGLNFGALLKDAMASVSAAAQKGDAQAQAVATGKANMIDVVTAVAETETTFQTLVSVRDKVIAAYEDVLKMQI